MSDWFERHNRYAAQEARAWLEQAKNEDLRWRDLLSTDAIVRRRVMKKMSGFLPFRPTFRFCYNYMWRCGFLDGKPGYEYCQLLSIYEQMIVRHTEALNHKEKGSS